MTASVASVYGTWKNQLDHRASVALAKEVAAAAPALSAMADLTVFPPMISLPEVAGILGDHFAIGSQNVTWDAEHALTGETKASSLAAMGCAVVMVGHSERRVHLGETDEQVVRKAESVLAHGMRALVCIGETYDERIAEASHEIIRGQLQSFQHAIQSLDDPGRLVLAYEPAWAITTNEKSLPANPELAAEDHRFIRTELERLVPEQAAELKLVYGAGVNASNVGEFLAIPDIDGVLAGGASQSIEKLTALLTAVSKAQT